MKTVNVMKIAGEYGTVKHLKSLIKPEQTGNHVRRILAELRFVCALSDRNNGKYGNIIEQTCSYLKEQYIKNGAWTFADTAVAEKLLMPASEEAKSYTFLCVGHAHIDMNFLWGYDETVGVVLDTFRTVLHIMDEYPDFKFSQSQASVYRIVEENDPEMLERIKRRVCEGRWEITASTWVEADKNMPNGESQARHILYTKNYLTKMFGVPAETLDIDFEPDTFGHSANVPEILSQSGVRFYYQLRGHIGRDVLYRWTAPSGAEVLLYTEPYWYTALIDECISDYAVPLEKITGMNTFLKIYGVGDHGGGPTRRDVERIIDMDKWPVYPNFKFSFLRDFFMTAQSYKNNFPVMNGEINPISDGCYTTQARIKAGNRKTEKLMREVELYSVLCSRLVSGGYPYDTYRNAWEKILFNQFHDILPGSCVPETREYASALYQQATASAEAQMKKSLNQICDRIDTSRFITRPADVSESIAEGAGVASLGPYCRGLGKERAYVLFNSDPFDRTCVTELMLWDYEGDLDYIAFYDSENREIPFQITAKNEEYWRYHWYSRVLIQATVPACGYALYYLKEREESKPETPFVNFMIQQEPETFVLENALLKVVLSSFDGSIKSMIYKPTGKEMADPDRPGGVFRLIQESDAKSIAGGSVSAWFTGRYKNIKTVNRGIEMQWVRNGPLRQTVSYRAKFGTASSINVYVSLDRDSADLHYWVDCDWREFGGSDGVPALSFYYPLNYECSVYQYDVPFGVADRPPMELDQPGLSYVAALGEDEILMLTSKTKYGYRCTDNAVRRLSAMTIKRYMRNISEQIN